MAKLFMIFQLLFVSVVAQTNVASTTTTQSSTKATDQPTTVVTSTLSTPSTSESTTKSTNSDYVTNSTTLTTESTTTEMSTTTTPIPTPNEPHLALMDFDLFCTCDLLAGQCDIDCCCDPDCSTEDRHLFDRCWTPPSSYFERYYCSADQNRYGVVWNNTPEFRTEWNPHNGLFCIVTDNVPKRRMFEEKPPTTDDEIFQNILPKLSGRWSNRHVPITGLENWIYQPFYKEGSPLFTLHRNGTINILKLPRSLNSASCNIAKPVGFLHPENYQCSLPGDLCNPEDWLDNLAVFRLPSYSAYSNGSIRWGDIEKLAPVILRICETESECRSELSPPQNCRNLSSVTVRIGFNGTDGVRFVLVDLLYTAKLAGRPVRFKTIYQSLADGNNPVRLRSGNPGYIQGKPLVVAKLNSSSGEGAFRSMELFANTTKSRLIRFGEDSYQIRRTNSVNMNNRTEWCFKWRQFVLQSYWGSADDVTELRLGAFGNVELNETTPGFWLPFEIQYELECYGSVIDAHLVILYTKSGSYDQPQNKLLGAGLKLRSDGETYCYESVDCSLLLSQTVSFVMVDSPTYMILPQPPRWKIELPRDFFYPFLLSSASGFSHVCPFLILFSGYFFFFRLL